MFITIISDIHDNEANLAKCLDWGVKNKSQELVCCGDTANFDTVRFIARRFLGRIHLVRGNCDNYDAGLLAEFSNIIYYGQIGRAGIGGLMIGLCHQPFLIEQVLGKGRCDFVFYGHTHKPWIENRGGVIIANPGTLGGTFQKPTFAFMDTGTKKLELKILETI